MVSASVRSVLMQARTSVPPAMPHTPAPSATAVTAAM